jgi:Uma2 family endonuclease
MLLSDLPEVELIDGLSVPKASPGRRHALLQGELGARLGAWAQERGEVGIEWRFYLAETPRRTQLVPDVAYVAIARMAPLSDEAARSRRLRRT